MKITEKYVFNLILSILLVLSVLGSSILMFVKGNLLSSEGFIKNCEDKNISEIVYDEIDDYFTKSADYSRIPADVYMSAISEEDIKKLIDAKTQGLFDYINGGNVKTYLDTEFDFSALEASITSYFEDFAKENNVQVDDAYEVQLQNTIDTAISEINGFADVYMAKLIDSTGIAEKVRRNLDLISIGMYGCIGLGAACIITLFIISVKRLANFFYWTSISGICAAVLGIIPTLYLKFSGITDKLVIRNKSVYVAFTGIMNKAIDDMLTVVITILVVSVVIMLIGMALSKSSKKKTA